MTAARIAELNDAARTSFIGCRVVITKGIAAMDCGAACKIDPLSGVIGV